MALDIFLRAETPAILETVVRSTAFRNIIGDVRDPESTGLRKLPGNVDWVYFAPNSVVITPGSPPVTDDWCWLHLRLLGFSEFMDLDGIDNEPDRWGRSKLRVWMQANGTLKTIRGVRVFEYKQGNKRVQLWRGSEMETLGVKFHEYQGGNFY